MALCYWEGLTQEQAARLQLGCPLGTVRSRLARARRLLHRRLTRRGLAPLAGVVASSFDSASAGAVALATLFGSAGTGSFDDPGRGPGRRRSGDGPGGLRRCGFTGPTSWSGA